MKSLKYSFVFFICLLAFSAKAQLIPQFSDQIVYSNFKEPVGITFGADGKGYIQEKKGRVRILDVDGSVMEDPLIDISEEVMGSGDHGMLGFALDPDFDENGYIYVMYTVDRYWEDHRNDANYDPDSTETKVATIGRITRYTTDFNNDNNSVIYSSRKVLLGQNYQNGFPILYTSHGVGTLAFGTDGTLLASCGEGSSFDGYDVGSYPETYWEESIALGMMKPKENIGAMRAQLIDCLAGKIIRIDKETGEGIPSNPYYDENNPSSNPSRVWTLGLRNPFRFTVRPGSGSIDPASGDPGALYVGDVGAGKWDEINIVTKPAENLGWPLFEGMEKNFNYYNQDVDNLDAPNPYFGLGNCQIEYIRYQDLLKQEEEDGDADYWSPCNEDDSIEGFGLDLFMHKRPNIAYSNGFWNKPTKTHVPIFDSLGNATLIEISDPDSPIKSNSFDGYSSIAGFFYDGDNFPQEYHGKYFHGDFAWWIRAMEIDETENIISVDSLHTRAQYLTSLALSPVDGCVYYTNLQSKLHKICYGGNPPPIAVANADQIYGVSPLTVTFDASESYDPFGEDLQFEWDFGDGDIQTGMNPTHTFVADDNSPTPFTVMLTVLDSINNYANDEIIISLNNTPPQVDVTSFEDGDFYSVEADNYLPLRATIEDAEHSSEEMDIKWETYLHHNTHFHKEQDIYNLTSYAALEPLGCNAETFWYRIILTVTDPAGLSTVISQNIYPYCGDPIVDFSNTLTGIAGENENNLTWQTQNEVNINHFEVQRSFGGGAFVKIGEVAANPSNYSFTDTQPLIGENVYRIKAIDQNNVPQYSNEVSIVFPIPPPYDVYPNPASDNLFVYVHNTAETKIDFELFSTDGKIINNTTWFVFPNETVVQKFEITPNIPDGIYYYRILNGDSEHTGTIMIKR